jgi:hypothetical protein
LLASYERTVIASTWATPLFQPISSSRTLHSGGLSAHPQAFVNGFHHAMLVATIIAAAGAAGTAMLLIPDRRAGPISHTFEQELPQFVGEK